MAHLNSDRRSASVSSNYEKKDAAIFHENTVPIHAGPQLPELLQGLSEDERSVLEKKLVRRIDLRLLPLLVIMYIMNYLDRNNIASARLAGEVGMQEELGMTSTQFSVCRFPHLIFCRKRRLIDS